jgi:putative transcriptional regulator
MLEDVIQYKTDIKVGTGKLLISEPMLREEPFHKSVIYVCHHDAHESVGYVLNRMANHGLASYVDELNGIDFPMYIGGPVGLDSLHILHSIPDLIGGDLVDDSIYWGGDLESAIEQIKLGKLTPQNCKFFIGYSGWDEGQLDAELDMNSWLVANTNPSIIFDLNIDNLWRSSIQQLGKKFNPLLYMPPSPDLN